MDESNDEFWYPSVEEIVAIHDSIVEEDGDSEPGIRDREQIEFVIDYIEHGHFGNVPGTAHEKAFHLMRLLASNHWFVDGNKRTALNTTIVFYAMNGYRLRYGEDVRSMLKLFSIREDLLDEFTTIDYLDERTRDLRHTELFEAFESQNVPDIGPNQRDPNS